MSLNCGISFEHGATTLVLSSVAIEKAVPVLTTDAVSVVSDNTKMKRGRITGAAIDSPLAYNRQVEFSISLTAADLGALRAFQKTVGGDPVIANVSRIDMFTDNNFDTPQNVVILNLTNIKRTKANYYSAKLGLVKI